MYIRYPRTLVTLPTTIPPTQLTHSLTHSLNPSLSHSISLSQSFIHPLCQTQALLPETLPPFPKEKGKAKFIPLQELVLSAFSSRTHPASPSHARPKDPTFSHGSVKFNRNRLTYHN